MIVNVKIRSTLSRGRITSNFTTISLNTRQIYPLPLKLSSWDNLLLHFGLKIIINTPKEYVTFSNLGFLTILLPSEDWTILIQMFFLRFAVSCVKRVWILKSGGCFLVWKIWVSMDVRRKSLSWVC